MPCREGTATGPNVMYFETGQGSGVASSEAHHGADQVVMEAPVLRLRQAVPAPSWLIRWWASIGPEYLYNSKQVIRAGLEDHFMGKLTGIPMGCDACYTNHIEGRPERHRGSGAPHRRRVQLRHGPQGDDVMLNYQSTGFHDRRPAGALRPHRHPALPGVAGEDGLCGKRQRLTELERGCVRPAGVDRAKPRTHPRGGALPRRLLIRSRGELCVRPPYIIEVTI